MYRHKVYLDDNKDIARKNNNYGRYKDADLIKQYATGICDFYKELDSEKAKKELAANKGRSLMQMYNCLRNGVVYDEATKKEIYDYVHPKNVALEEMISKCNDEAMKDKLRSQLKDESVFGDMAYIA